MIKTITYYGAHHNHNVNTNANTSRTHHKRTTSAPRAQARAHQVNSASTPGKQCENITAPRSHEREHHEHTVIMSTPRTHHQALMFITPCEPDCVINFECTGSFGRVIARRHLIRFRNTDACAWRRIMGSVRGEGWVSESRGMGQ